MDYQKHYNLLINRAKHKKPEGYCEEHHIIPECMGGGNEKENLVLLTPEEHFLAHKLLIKIYPDNHGLVFAAKMMTVGNENQDRSNNKFYGWLKRRFAIVISEKMKKLHTGKKQSAEHIRKRTESRKGKPNNIRTKRPVICIELNKEFDSCYSAAKFINIKCPGVIRKVANGQGKTAGGYHWRYAEKN